jgi:hypothetical protein
LVVDWAREIYVDIIEDFDVESNMPIVNKRDAFEDDLFCDNGSAIDNCNEYLVL